MPGIFSMDHHAMNPNDREAAEAVYRQASGWMKRGIALLEKNTAADLSEAVACFDVAIVLRRGLPLAANPFFRYGLAAGWMNRGDALTRLGSPENLAAALQSYDRALEVLGGLDPDANPLFRRRVAIAWQNRGLTLQAQGPTAWPEAERSFREAMATLNHEKAAAISDRNYLLAAAWVNLANTLANAPMPAGALATDQKIIWADEARRLAKQALALATPTESQEAAMAEIGFKARHILCQAIAELLMRLDQANQANQSEPAGRSKDKWVAEATDAVDTGMALARHWERQNIVQFRLLAPDLFRFGARIYQAYQPHFLNEFLLENLDPAHAPPTLAGRPEMRAAALDGLWRSFRAIQQRGFKNLNTPEFDALLEQLRELRVIEEHLQALRRQYLDAHRAEKPVK
jgi:hypothetical protein